MELHTIHVTHTKANYRKGKRHDEIERIMMRNKHLKSLVTETQQNQEVLK